MECSKYAQEKIGETDSAQFREHLAGCDGCRRDLEELREVRSLYREASTEKYRGGIPRLRRSRAAGFPLVAAAALLVGVFALILGVPRREGPKSTDATSTSTVFVRIRLEPWGSDRRITSELDDCWRKLEHLE
ncbi:MAG TPA: hypothetical protein VMU54_24395, partial [Planctomycetota bacterium]|nr:hypothetical protein [Planctomycetota bacterium]